MSVASVISLSSSVDGSSCRSWMTSSSGISHLAHSTIADAQEQQHQRRAGRRATGV